MKADPDEEDEDDSYFNAGAGQTYDDIKAALNDTGIHIFEDDFLDDNLFTLRHPSEDCLDSQV